MRRWQGGEAGGSVPSQLFSVTQCERDYADLGGGNGRLIWDRFLINHEEEG
jgi:hypothetical protein